MFLFLSHTTAAREAEQANLSRMRGVVGGLSFASLIHRKGECFALWPAKKMKSLLTLLHPSFGKAYDL
jgi:hypothetical protein